MLGKLYLTRNEVKAIFQSISNGRNGDRDRCMILMCFIHGLRISELTGIRISDINFSSGRIYIRRLKNGFSTTHPLHPKEISLLKKWLDIRTEYNVDETKWLFISRKGQRLTRQQLYRMLKNLGKSAGLDIDVHPHMLRHACGFELAEQGIDTRLIQDYLGHRNIRHTVHYTASNAARFNNLWRDENSKIEPEIRMSFLAW
ncbi:tyrosine-type DNA invertase [Yokenella regensburgei]|uniref:tyrosine-type DNA invertase n=1 Tax=Yokenella regensburgei TaxID=158877 RepID=UPI0028984A5C|nr:tyrosine-type DNA invertase [Yokenella regensburgei]